MGKSLSSLWNAFMGKKAARILLIGLDNAGKSSILYTLKYKDSEIQVIPTIGFNVEVLQFKNIQITCWDISGSKKSREFLRLYMPNDAYCFVIDSNDRDRINEAKDFFKFFLQHKEYKNEPICIFLNKQDVEGCMSKDEFIKEFDINSILSEAKKKINYDVVPCSAKENVGIEKGFDYVCKSV